MKLTKSKLEQLIREALAETKMDFSWGTNPPPDTSTPSGQADYEDWERRARGHAAFVAMGEDEEDEATLPLSLEDLAEFDVATAALVYVDKHRSQERKERNEHPPPWAKAVYHVIDSQFGEEEWSPTPGGRHPIEISEPSLRTLSWALNLPELPGWLEDNEYIDDDAMAALPVVKEKVQALLAGEEKQAEPEKAEPEKAEPEKAEPVRAKRCLNDTDCTEDETCYKGQCQPQRTHGRFGTLEFDEALKRYKEGKSMKLTRNTLEQLIKEELEVAVADTVYVKDMTFTPNDKGVMNVISAAGEDSWSPLKDKTAFEAWRAAILELDKAEQEERIGAVPPHTIHDPDSSAKLWKKHRWVPAGGPWKWKADAYRKGKAAQLAKWGSSR